MAMLSEVITDLLAGDRGFQGIRQPLGVGLVLAAVIIAEIGDVARFQNVVSGPTMAPVRETVFVTSAATYRWQYVCQASAVLSCGSI